MDEKLEFLKFTQEYQERRIQMLDTKSDIFLVLITGMIVVYSYIVKELVLAGSKITLVTMGYLSLGVNLLLSSAVLLFFIQTIRPTTRFLGISHRSKIKNLECGNWICWPEEETCSKSARKTGHEFMKRFDSIMEASDNRYILENIRKLLYATSQDLYDKWQFYRKAVWLFKVLLIFYVTSLMLLTIVLLITPP